LQDRPPTQGRKTVPERARGRDGRVVAGLGVALVALSALLTLLSRPLVTSAAPGGMLSFEFAASAPGAAAILDSWSGAARSRALVVLALDMVYLVVYAAWFALACRRLGARLGGAWAPLGRALARAAIAAGGLDAVENAALAALVLGGPAGAPAALAAGCAAVKFVAVGAAALFLLAGAGAWAARRLGPRSPA
jgi:hypothetical protein